MDSFLAPSTNLDTFDIQILRELRTNGRISIQELSERIGLSPTPAARRLRHLEDAGIITGYCALIDEVALGYEVSVFVSVQLDKQVDVSLDQFEKAIQAFPEVVDCWLMTGNRDYLLRVATTGLTAFEVFLTGKLTKVPGVANIESSIPLRRVKSGVSRTP
ncbi:MAG: Lrp/AsnC family transcriptional regulator [Roseibium sp.]|uniref:Lrp/AsnC family transcriptional regulator n=1 Tax=Roseibium sp. TaxID=1936156 RepID=UPI001B1AEBFD|nr:Lrp/AsnC family transcriptional regulator [Roseibium sp.]MBO6509197.1 Lrp/AsnC family transcriptional regulator [Roseibium sp.]MBO6892618.1 Lrp/AsnC family transcriptional regulator [Roseibium sp.]MBO6928252.1 Lrp/AsnC family transcriptional regulator [Roseibium sp.]